jgi:hypothetical protein
MQSSDGGTYRRFEFLVDHDITLTHATNPSAHHFRYRLQVDGKGFQEL